MDTDSYLFGFIVSGFTLGSLVALLPFLKRKRSSPIADRLSTIGVFLGYLFALSASLAGIILSARLLLQNRIAELVPLPELPAGPFTVRIDQLSAFFLLVISLLGSAVSLYSFGYAREYSARLKGGILGFLFNIFLLSMVLVVTAGNAVFFLIAWEVMSLTTYFLINFDHEDESSRKASIRYVVMTHAGTAFLIAMFLLLANASGSFEFSEFAGHSGLLAGPLKTGLFLCALIGFGLKAGIVPLHVWLPDAHPAAPSNVSALMSGVMIKTGIYGLIRVLFDFLGTPPVWWGIGLLLIAVVSAVLGVLYALMEHDIKRLLAFHSIENIGIILMGVGAASLFLSYGNVPLAVLSIIAGLYHVLNHAMFKGLLFLGAGSIVHATHTKNIDELGGLAKKLPWTAVFFLIGSAAISALPPLNGFVSEWLTYQALFLGFQIPDLVVRIAIPLTVALLAMTGALAAACFVKAFGTTFLGLPRSSRVEHAKESSPTMLVSMAILSAGCIFLGLAPGTMVSLLTPVSSMLMKQDLPVPAIVGWGSISFPQSAGSGISPVVVALMLLVLFFVPILIGLWVAGRLRSRSAMIWACGLERVSPGMQYTATGFSKPIRMIFSNIFRARHEIEAVDEPQLYFTRKIRFHLKTESIFEKYIYTPIVAATVAGAKYLRRVQTGHIQSYLAYIFIVLILLLIFAR